MIEDNAPHDPSTSGAVLLAEVIYAVEQLPHEPSAYPAIYDLAVTCDQSGFFESSLVLYDRCLRIADHRRRSPGRVRQSDRGILRRGSTAESEPGAAQPSPARRPVRRDGGARSGGQPAGRPDVCGAWLTVPCLFAELGHHSPR